MRFLHTADWQLGMTRHFLDGDAQPRYTQARIDAIARLGKLAQDQECEFILVCGDVFESNHLPPRVIKRALEAMRAVPVPIYLLPGNHDPLDAGSIYRSPAFVDSCPDNVHVLEDTGAVAVAPGVELIGAPWFSKHPNRDLVAEALETTAYEAPASGITRIIAGHGIVDSLSPDPNNPALISLETMQRAIAAGQAHFIALGDRHSVTDVGSSGAIWYSGAPEVTDFDDVEIASGRALVVDLSQPQKPAVTRHEVGEWAFRTLHEELVDKADVARVLQTLEGMTPKDRTVVRLGLKGTLALADNAQLEAGLEAQREVFASLNAWERHMDLAVYVDDSQLSDLGVSGFIAEAVGELSELAQNRDDGADDDGGARDALSLLYRLAGGAR